MSEQVVIDGFEFARVERTLAGRIELAKLSRLHDLLYSDSGVIDYALAGEIDPEGQPLLHLRVGGAVRLKCQRCLGAMEYPLDISSRLALYRDEKELVDIEDEDPDTDSIVVEDKLDVLSLVEDEILLELPFAPRHVAGECEADGERDEGGNRQSAFAGLAALKNKLSATD